MLTSLNPAKAAGSDEIHARNLKELAKNFAPGLAAIYRKYLATGIVPVDWKIFSKAFDMVDHDLLIYKLSNHGIVGNVNHWIQNFLSNRHQAVIIGGEKSDFVPVTSGIPQGSDLGPILFLFYINDIANVLDSTIHLFADDTVVCLVIKSKSDGMKLQRDLNCLGILGESGGWSFIQISVLCCQLQKVKHPFTMNINYTGSPWSM